MFLQISDAFGKNLQSQSFSSELSFGQSSLLLHTSSSDMKPPLSDMKELLYSMKTDLSCKTCISLMLLWSAVVFWCWYLSVLCGDTIDCSLFVVSIIDWNVILVKCLTYFRSFCSFLWFNCSFPYKTKWKHNLSFCSTSLEKPVGQTELFEISPFLWSYVSSLHITWVKSFLLQSTMFHVGSTNFDTSIRKQELFTGARKVLISGGAIASLVLSLTCIRLGHVR